MVVLNVGRIDTASTKVMLSVSARLRITPPVPRSSRSVFTVLGNNARGSAGSSGRVASHVPDVPSAGTSTVPREP